VNENLAPIAVFAYRRTNLLTKTLDALERCPEFADSPVFIFSDGPRSGGAEADVAAVRKLVRGRLRRNMTLIESSMNRGLAASIISGVSQLCNDHGRVIVVEDDLIVSPSTLTWFNAAGVSRAQTLPMSRLVIVTGAQLKTVYGKKAFEEFDASSWDKKYPANVQSWRRNWEHVTAFLSFPRPCGGPTIPRMPSRP
jgi:hypothetical protein